MDSTIAGNKATEYGGGLYFYGTSPLLTNCLIIGNEGSGVHCEVNSSATLINCTIADNWGGSGHGIYCVQSSPTLTNCILWNHGNEIVATPSSSPIVRYSCIRGSYPGEGNIDGNPLFADSSAGDYHLKNGSACIDRGLVSATPEMDLDGRPRPGDDGLVDMGAYESPDEWVPGQESHTPKLWHVRADAPVSGDGTSWASAWPSISSALEGVGASDEVWVTGGTYHEAIQLKSGISIYGGFSGYETTRDQRDWKNNETIINAAGFNAEVVTSASGVILDGFTLTGGKGGVYCTNSSLTLNNCTIFGNAVSYNGGGVFCENKSVLALNDCTIKNNRSYSSYMYDDYPYFYIYSGKGGGVFCRDSSLIMNRCIVSGNHAYEYGGGIHSDSSSVKLTHCLIADNELSRDGGGFYSVDSSLTMTNCWIGNNRSIGGYGGGSYFCTSSLVMTNCIIVGNRSGNLGGGIYYRSNNSFIMYNCAVIDNIADFGGDGIFCIYSSPKINHCILWNPKDEIDKDSDSTITVTYSCVEGGWEGEGNIDSDPMFVHPWDGSWADLRLLPGSPCIDAGNPDAAYNDACLPPGLGGERCDMGAYGGPLNCAGVPEIPTPTPTPMPSPTPTVTPLPTWTPTVTPTATATPKLPPSKEHPQLWLLDGRGRIYLMEEKQGQSDKGAE